MTVGETMIAMEGVEEGEAVLRRGRKREEDGAVLQERKMTRHRGERIGEMIETGIEGGIRDETSDGMIGKTTGGMIGEMKGMTIDATGALEGKRGEMKEEETEKEVPIEI